MWYKKNQQLSFSFNIEVTVSTWVLTSNILFNFQTLLNEPVESRNNEMQIINHTSTFKPSETLLQTIKEKLKDVLK